MKVSINIDSDNDAMQTFQEAAAAVRGVASRIREGRTQGKILDVNGNTVGSWEAS